MHSLTRFAVGLLGAAVLVSLLAAASRAAEQPNILWLTSEDHGPHLGCYGDANARTPNVDALAAKGMLSTRVWSCAPVCAPARTAIITGMYPSSLGALHMRSSVPAPDGAKLLPQLLREAGYYCSNNHKEDYNVAAHGKVWNESSKKAHWRGRGDNQPFFAVFNSTHSHESQIRTRPHRQIMDPANVLLPAYHPDAPRVREDWAQYYDKVSEADADAGARLRELDADGLADETIVFYFADHGSGMPRNKRWPGNSGLHVPLVVYFPEKWRHLAPKDYTPGGRSERLASFVDFAPTALSIAGVAAPAMMQGRAFAGASAAEAPKYLYGERGRMDERVDVIRSVTDGQYVYLRNYFPHVSQAQLVTYQLETPTTRVWKRLFDEGRTNAAQSIFWSTPKAPEELYDLKSDPDEVRNLADLPAHQEKLLELREAHRRHALEIRDASFLPEGEMHARSDGGSPYDMARDDAKYPLARIMQAANLASMLRPEDAPALAALLKSDDDSAVRYWAALGLLMRGSDGVATGRDALNAALADKSPYVRIAAAEALGQFEEPAEVNAALAVLGELAPPEKGGYFVTAAALNAIDALGAKAAPLTDIVRSIPHDAALPQDRFKNSLPRLQAHIAN